MGERPASPPSRARGGCAKVARSSAPSRPGWQGDRPRQPPCPRLEGAPGLARPIGPAYAPHRTCLGVDGPALAVLMSRDEEEPHVADGWAPLAHLDLDRPARPEPPLPWNEGLLPRLPCPALPAPPRPACPALPRSRAEPPTGRSPLDRPTAPVPSGAHTRGRARRHIGIARGGREELPARGAVTPRSRDAPLVGRRLVRRSSTARLTSHATGPGRLAPATYDGIQ